MIYVFEGYTKLRCRELCLSLLTTVNSSSQVYNFLCFGPFWLLFMVCFRTAARSLAKMTSLSGLM
ncbi:hypothetical protein MANES_11G054050v8 [Manihot esculenta]|uniref:Uncharacterized protein n=1 Tax=Manihot esculenta TaxID=3983 RepID=A0ACB7GTJ3_MANES|nr:hypothetical protein MANES_11G054050v8 [Manihot esculenta]